MLSMSSKASPCLMRAPVVKDGVMCVEFYDLKDGNSRKKLSMTKHDEGVGDDEFPPDGVRLVGCSHGWVATYDENSSRVYLSNPITRRHIKLPPLNTVSDPYIQSKYHGCKTILSCSGPPRVILSCSPDNGEEEEEEEEEYRALAIFGPGGRLCFCAPGRSSEWTPLGYGEFPKYFDYYESRPHVDLAYCSSRKVFTSITCCRFELDKFFEDRSVQRIGYCKISNWNLLHPKHPRKWHLWVPNCDEEELERDEGIIIPTEDVGSAIRYLRKSSVDDYYDSLEGSSLWEDSCYLEMLKNECDQEVHVVRADELSDHPLAVLRFVNRVKGNKTVCFLVLQLNEKDCTGNCFLLVEDLKNLVIFVGISHSYAIPAASAPHLKPNSIYFTDYPGRDSDSDCGVFDYVNKTINYYHANDHGPASFFWFHNSNDPTPTTKNACVDAEEESLAPDDIVFTQISLA